MAARLVMEENDVLSLLCDVWFVCNPLLGNVSNEREIGQDIFLYSMFGNITLFMGHPGVTPPHYGSVIIQLAAKVETRSRGSDLYVVMPFSKRQLLHCSRSQNRVIGMRRKSPERLEKARS
jgi:hypothetical protein